MVKVSVIVPVYKVERYIERCARLLFEQTLDEIEYIFVDDCTPDKSIDVLEKVLEDYPARKKQVKIIRHKVNLGVSQSRQDGVDAATGEYVIHCDPDDWVELNMYEALYTEAKRKDADMVICDFYNNNNGNQKIEIQKPDKLESLSVLEGISGRSFHRLHGSLCNKLIKSACYTGVSFPKDINYCEDVFVLFQILAKDRVIEYLNKGYYHYKTDVPNSLFKIVDENAQKMDMRLIVSLQEIANTKNRRFKECVYSFSIQVIYYRAFLFGNINSKIFKDRYFLLIRDFAPFNISIPRLQKKLLYLSANGYHRISREVIKVSQMIRIISKYFWV